MKIKRIMMKPFIIIVSQIHYQNRRAKSPSNPQGGGAKNFGMLKSH